jgi:5'-nucleotidase
MFQGTPYFNIYGGKIIFELMNLMSYDAATFGNHEFDNGIDWLAEKINYAKFSFVNCNYEASGTALNGKFKRWSIIEKGKLKIGITGVGINPDSLISEKNCNGLIYKDPVTESNKIAKLLKEDKCCDFVIVLSHLGLDMGDKIDDKKLAQQTRNIDLILGGHTHTFMGAPLTINNLDNKPVVIHHSGAEGINISRLDFNFTRNKKILNFE